jgi:hypothetical protein
MPDSQPTPWPTLGELARQALAATEPAARLRLVGRLGRTTRADYQMGAVADILLAAGPAGNRVLLEWVARVPGKIPADVVAKVVPVVAARHVPVSVRVAAAARLLRTVPDRIASVRPITRAASAGLSPLRGLERLRQLQHEVERCRALDKLIDRRELRVKLDCPRCGVRLPRMEMVKHLWHDHGLWLDAGKVRSPQRAAEELQAEFAEGQNPDAIDRAAILSGPSALRRWLANADTPAEELAPFRNAAEEHRAGLCPGCLAELPAPVPPLPPPLDLADGRLAGDGFTVEVGGAAWVRTLTIAAPDRVLRFGFDRPLRIGPRGAAALVALPVLLAAFAVAALLSPAVIQPFLVVSWAVVLAVVLYGLVWVTRPPLPPADDRAVGAAWSVLARRLAEGTRGTRFLMRLCRTSIGRGDPLSRSAVLARVVERAAGAAAESDEALQLLAVARVLQMEDAARLGRDRVAAIAALIAEAFSGAQPADFAEHAASAFLDRTPPPDPADLARLRVLLIGAAFDALMRPRDLLNLWAVAPGLRRAMMVEPAHRLGLLYGLWQIRTVRTWEKVGPADTAFELARIAPNLSGRVLRDFPDVLLHARPDPALGDELGPVLVCARGVVVGGRMTSDLDTKIDVIRSGRFGGYELTLGLQSVRLTRKPPDGFVGSLRGWLRFRANVLLPFIDGYLEPGPREVAERVLGPFCRKCRQCGTVSAVAVGKVGVAIRTDGGASV